MYHQTNTEITMKDLVANELQAVGFETKVKGDVVKVTLTTRKVSTLEVATALAQVFNEIEFTLITSFNGVIVLI